MENVSILLQEPLNVTLFHYDILKYPLYLYIYIVMPDAFDGESIQSSAHFYISFILQSYLQFRM